MVISIKITMPAKKVILGISGGVDSSVSAILLKEQGYDVEAVFMKNWEEDDTEEYCSSAADLNDAKAVCAALDIKLTKVNFALEYWENVFENFLEEYKKGRTPNPDILCNKEIKFKAFFNYAIESGADYIATGHYAGISKDNNKYYLTKGLDSNKDQSYFLYAIDNSVLSKVIFPLQNLVKTDIRAIAEKYNLATAKKKDSTGICFIGERKFKDFLQNFIPAKPGIIHDEDGNPIGKHDGLMYYTIGQRKGLNIGGLKSYEPSPWYVVDKDLTNNILIVGNSNSKKLFQKELTATNWNFLCDAKEILQEGLKAKIRYRQAEQPCTINKLEHDKYLISFDEPQKAVTPGQSVVIYKDNICLGGGIIN